MLVRDLCKFSVIVPFLFLLRKVLPLPPAKSYFIYKNVVPMPISFHTSGQGEFEVSRQILPCQHYDKQPSNCTLSLVKDKLEYGEWLRVVFKIYLINLESRSVCCLDKIVMVKLQVWPQHACCAASASLLIIPCEGLEDNEMNTEGKVEHKVELLFPLVPPHQELCYHTGFVLVPVGLHALNQDRWAAAWTILQKEKKSFLVLIK